MHIQQVGASELAELWDGLGIGLLELLELLELFSHAKGVCNSFLAKELREGLVFILALILWRWQVLIYRPGINPPI